MAARLVENFQLNPELEALFQRFAESRFHKLLDSLENKPETYDDTLGARQLSTRIKESISPGSRQDVTARLVHSLIGSESIGEISLSVDRGILFGFAELATREDLEKTEWFVTANVESHTITSGVFPMQSRRGDRLVDFRNASLGTFPLTDVWGDICIDVFRNSTPGRNIFGDPSSESGESAEDPDPPQRVLEDSSSHSTVAGATPEAELRTQPPVSRPKGIHYGRGIISIGQISSEVSQVLAELGMFEPTLIFRALPSCNSKSNKVCAKKPKNISARSAAAASAASAQCSTVAAETTSTEPSSLTRRRSGTANSLLTHVVSAPRRLASWASELRVGDDDAALLLSGVTNVANNSTSYPGNNLHLMNSSGENTTGYGGSRAHDDDEDDSEQVEARGDPGARRPPPLPMRSSSSSGLRAKEGIHPQPVSPFVLSPPSTSVPFTSQSNQAVDNAGNNHTNHPEVGAAADHERSEAGSSTNGNVSLPSCEIPILDGRGVIVALTPSSARIRLTLHLIPHNSADRKYMRALGGYEGIPADIHFSSKHPKGQPVSLGFIDIEIEVTLRPTFLEGRVLSALCPPYRRWKEPMTIDTFHMDCRVQRAPLAFLKLFICVPKFFHLLNEHPLVPRSKVDVLVTSVFWFALWRVFAGLLGADFPAALSAVLVAMFCFFLATCSVGSRPSFKEIKPLLKVRTNPSSSNPVSATDDETVDSPMTMDAYSECLPSRDAAAVMALASSPPRASTSSESGRIPPEVTLQGVTQHVMHGVATEVTKAVSSFLGSLLPGASTPANPQASTSVNMNNRNAGETQSEGGDRSRRGSLNPSEWDALPSLVATRHGSARSVGGRAREFDLREFEEADGHENDEDDVSRLQGSRRSQSSLQGDNGAGNEASGKLPRPTDASASMPSSQRRLSIGFSSSGGRHQQHQQRRASSTFRSLPMVTQASFQADVPANTFCWADRPVWLSSGPSTSSPPDSSGPTAPETTKANPWVHQNFVASPFGPLLLAGKDRYLGQLVPLMSSGIEPPKPSVRVLDILRLMTTVQVAAGILSLVCERVFVVFAPATESAVWISRFCMLLIVVGAYTALNAAVFLEIWTNGCISILATGIVFWLGCSTDVDVPFSIKNVELALTRNARSFAALVSALYERWFINVVCWIVMRCINWITGLIHRPFMTRLHLLTCISRLDYVHHHRLFVLSGTPGAEGQSSTTDLSDSASFPLPHSSPRTVSPPPPVALAPPSGHVVPDIMDSMSDEETTSIAEENMGLNNHKDSSSKSQVEDLLECDDDDSPFPQVLRRRLHNGVTSASPASALIHHPGSLASSPSTAAPRTPSVVHFLLAVEEVNSQKIARELNSEAEGDGSGFNDEYDQSFADPVSPSTLARQLKMLKARKGVLQWFHSHARDFERLGLKQMRTNASRLSYILVFLEAFMSTCLALVIFGWIQSKNSPVAFARLAVSVLWTTFKNTLMRIPDQRELDHRSICDMQLVSYSHLMGTGSAPGSAGRERLDAVKVLLRHHRDKAAAARRLHRRQKPGAAAPPLNFSPLGHVTTTASSAAVNLGWVTNRSTAVSPETNVPYEHWREERSVMEAFLKGPSGLPPAPKARIGGWLFGQPTSHGASAHDGGISVHEVRRRENISSFLRTAEDAVGKKMNKSRR